MFTFNHELAALVFENDFINFKCVPSELYSVRNNVFKSNPTNGEFQFSYDEDKIVFIFSAYGNGNGGYNEVTIKMSDDIRKSLKKALRDWEVYAFGTPVETIIEQIYTGKKN